ncbi:MULTISPECIES: type II toxin-antitoxin system VapB family antitoxin [Leptolyngbya]|uniref:type II toxin-antitoxin system VapB family antitoxin n=1 Tax=Leptolyngbya TaxID=47251 RepID=UPI001687497D|nr:type II toxin-antitoxin system VapB family antitoxin [Leptolyngbya sp. FACHB-1624]MBD1858432.1 type II toxin-antitoxin system VapB family antitoxin [Leptolyngbya sp. FACHB-1624]
MTHSLNLDESLIQEALALDEQQNLESVIEAALREYIQRRQRRKIIDLFGTIDYDETYDYKAQRQIS